MLQARFRRVAPCPATAHDRHSSLNAGCGSAGLNPAYAAPSVHANNASNASSVVAGGAHCVPVHT